MQTWSSNHDDEVTLQSMHANAERTADTAVVGHFANNLPSTP